MIQVRFVLLAPLCMLGACAMFSDKKDTNQPVAEKRVDNAMLQHVDASERADVTTARQTADIARDAHAAAQAETQRATDRRRLADRELELADAEQKRWEEAVKGAQSGTQEELDRANQGVVDSQALVAAARSRITLRDRQLEYAKAYEELKLRNSELAQAKVESTKAHAVSTLDRPQAKAVNVDEFERQVREAQEKVQLAEVRVDAVRKEVETARSAYDHTVEAVPASFRRDWPTEDEQPMEERPRN